MDGKFLKITGRIKEQYKLENGKYVVPAPLEDILSHSKFIHQAFVYGVNREYNVALLVLDMAAVEEWAKTEGVLPMDERVQQMIGNEVNNV